MPCAKLYEFSTKDPMDIPLLEMARKSLECQSDKVYHCFKEDREFDVVIGAKNDEEVKEACGDVCEIIHDFRLPHNFSGYMCHHEKSGAIYHDPTWFWWSRNDPPGDKFKRRPKDLELEFLIEIVNVQQNATIFKIPFDSNVVVIAGTSDKDLAKRIFHQRFWINPDKEDLDYISCCWVPS